jgi:signal transduction histidine kinase
MARLVQDLVDISRLATHHFQLQCATDDLVRIARQQIELASARSRAHTFSLDAPDQLIMFFDPDRLAQVFANLLTNAIDHTPDGNIRVSLWKERRQARLSVRDEGPGIPTDSLEAIFDARVRLNGHASTDRPTGAGLGLSIARAIVHAHNGRIWAESTPGEGAAFHVSLPLGSPPRPRRPVGNRSHAGSPAAGGRRRPG